MVPVRRLLSLAAALTIAVPSALATTANAQARPDATGSAGIGDPYYPLYGNGGYDVRHYRIDDTYRTHSGRLTGHTTIRAVATQRLSRFDLDFVLHVDRVVVDGLPATFTQPNEHELVVAPRRVLASGAPFTVTVNYHGIPGRTVVNGIAPWISGPGEAMAMGEPEIAAWWFPSNDHPRDKATYDVTVRVPHGQQVVGDGVLVSRTPGPTFTAWRWRMDEPMASYLAAFAAGRFRIESGTADGLPYTYAVSRQLSQVEQDSSIRLLRRTPRIVTWLIQHYGPYPFDAIGGVITSLRSGFAMENQSRPAYPYMGDGRGATSTVVHELAHQWFGDSVSVNRWRDIWLNEGFATFVEWQWAEEKHGRDGAEWLQHRYSLHPRNARIWRVTIGNPGIPHLFDGAVYERGAMTLQALRNRIGDADFQTVLKTWVVDHAGSTARIGQFERLAETISGQDLSSFFAAWLMTDHRPAHTAANGLA